MENEGVSPVCPVDPGSPLFLSGDGFEPVGVLFPHAVFHFPSKDKKEACHFMDKVVDKHRRMCDERQRLGLKKQTLEARIARVERKVRALESDPFQWEWRNFDSVAKIPKMLRMYLRARDFSRVGMMDGDVPNVPSRRPSPPCGFFRSQIRAPCALIKDLPDKDQEIAMAFIKALVIQHQKLTLERRKLRKKIHRMQRRVTAISRDLHTLNSHPGDWIELGISEFARIPDCMMPILDLAGQGVQVFCSSRRIS
ncbi:hypothetical protein ISN45_Aa03g040310 [Arabidopsis thaliana x Arabidopsis arenosa]|uniref:Uncharacterized protein n=1 Tax=Arabidopsis thaliana x Arabidopsis arenosa TaxID=1240361 RepID=A0A8T2B007_9BRAS|nr:hypothetical protein ISN45_Aa03g040310 [Arabidopsis thaliana x Arabidopsis arenosa]